MRSRARVVSACSVVMIVALLAPSSMAGATGTWGSGDAPEAGAKATCNIVMEFNGADAGFSFNGWGFEFACQAAIPTGQTPFAFDPANIGVTGDANWPWGHAPFRNFPGGIATIPRVGTCGVGRPTTWGVEATTGQNKFFCEAPGTASGLSVATDFDQLDNWAGIGSPANYSLFEISDITGATYGPDEGGLQAAEFTGWVKFPACSEGIDGVLSHDESNCWSDNYPYITQDWYGHAGDCSTTTTPPPSLPWVNSGTTPQVLEMWNGSDYDIAGTTLYSVTCSNSGVEPTMPPNFYTGGTADKPNVPCDYQASQGEPDGVPDGHTAFPQEVWFGGPAELVVVDPSDGSTPTQTIHGQMFSANAVRSAVNPSSPVTLDVTGDTDPLLGGAEYPWYCYYGGTWYWGGVTGGTGSGTPPTPGGGEGVFDFGACVASHTSGLSLYNPITWVTALGGVALCTLEWLFEPFGFDSSSLTSAFTTHEPGVFLSDAFDGVSTMLAGASDGLGESACNAPHISANFAHLLHVGDDTSDFTATLPAPASLGCTGVDAVSAGDLFGYRYLVRDIGTAAVWIMVVIAAWRMMPWRSRGIKIIDAYGSLNDEGEYVKTYQTNEGSDV